ncbi:hypothetical protein FVR03_10490 [Pontibacter qinzhouensis]|uniref:Peptidoglycan-binding protein n=1 Tax=Pontibacter qinzhouensis TaxID=2603253 RepID=A0A5C8K8I1_9BACT|nr:hypothetical protein FVR03_10490 [Pontibacter qinzhouensis]
MLAYSQNEEKSRYHHQPEINQTNLVYSSTKGTLKYSLYANAGESELINMLPDFSFAGYKSGGVALPDLPVVKILYPKPGDNREHIQRAIDAVSQLTPDSNGFRGKILLKAGTYEVSDSLTLKASGVVLAGEGQGANGTVLRATKKAKHTLIVVGDGASRLPKLRHTSSPISTKYVPTGAVTFSANNLLDYSIGDTILVQKTPNLAWVRKLDMNRYDWSPESFIIPHERIITSITNTSITVNIPMVDAIKQEEGGGQVVKIRSQRKTKNAGIENMRLVSAYAHDEDEEHGWEAIALRMAENCWVKKVTAQYFGYSCVTIDKRSVYNTIEDCAMLDPKSQTKGKRKYSFYIHSGSFNLFQRCFTKGGRHDYVTGSRVSGPNVFLDCLALETQSDIGPHHRWATGTLFDNVQGGDIRVRNRKDSGTGHGWSGAQTMFWNCISTTKKGITVESPPGSINWLVGGRANKYLGNGHRELTGSEVTPRSLYLAQLEERLGKAAIDQIATAPQQDGTIFDLLEKWAGETPDTKETGTPPAGPSPN